MNTQKKPMSLREATEQARATARPLTEEESRALVRGQEPEDVADEPEPEDAGSVFISDKVPAWAQVPQDLTFPANGKKVYFFKFPAAWTENPERGDRQCIIWGLTYNDEKLALSRCKGDHMRTVHEHARGMIRAVDGARSNWTVRPSNVDTFWEEIGSKCRSLISAHYLKTHSLTAEEKVLFFTECFAETSSR